MAEKMNEPMATDGPDKGSGSGGDRNGGGRHHHHHHIHPRGGPFFYPSRWPHYGFGDFGADPFSMMEQMNRFTRDFEDSWDGGRGHRHQTRASERRGEEEQKQDHMHAHTPESEPPRPYPRMPRMGYPHFSHPFYMHPYSQPGMNFFPPTQPPHLGAFTDMMDDWVWRTPRGNLLPSLDDSAYYGMNSLVPPAALIAMGDRPHAGRVPEGEPAPHSLMPYPCGGEPLSRGFFGRHFPFGSGSILSSGMNTTCMPRVDVRDSGTELVVHADLPGMRKEDVRVDIKDGSLIISGDRSDKKEELNENSGEEGAPSQKGTKTYRQERCRSRFYRAFTLPHNVKDKEIKATFENGVLEVSVPHEPKAIEGSGGTSIQID